MSSTLTPKEYPRCWMPVQHMTLNYWAHKTPWNTAETLTIVYKDEKKTSLLVFILSHTARVICSLAVGMTECETTPQNVMLNCLLPDLPHPPQEKRTCFCHSNPEKHKQKSLLGWKRSYRTIKEFSCAIHAQYFSPHLQPEVKLNVFEGTEKMLNWNFNTTQIQVLHQP